MRALRRQLSFCLETGSRTTDKHLYHAYIQRWSHTLFEEAANTGRPRATSKGLTLPDAVNAMIATPSWCSTRRRDPSALDSIMQLLWTLSVHYDRQSASPSMLTMEGPELLGQGDCTLSNWKARTVLRILNHSHDDGYK